jgi:hypothetical protein
MEILPRKEPSELSLNWGETSSSVNGTGYRKRYECARNYIFIIYIRSMLISSKDLHQPVTTVLWTGNLHLSNGSDE